MVRRNTRVMQGVFLAVLATSLGAAMYHGMRHPGAGSETEAVEAAPLTRAWAQRANGYDDMRKELLERIVGSSLTPVVDTGALPGKWEVRSVREAKPAEWVREYRRDGRLIVTHLDAGAAREEARWMMADGILMEVFGEEAPVAGDADGGEQVMHLYRQADGQLIESSDDAKMIYALTRVKD